MSMWWTWAWVCCSDLMLLRNAQYESKNLVLIWLLKKKKKKSETPFPAFLFCVERKVVDWMKAKNFNARNIMVVSPRLKLIPV